MPDLHERFHTLDRVSVPDLWAEAELRAAQPLGLDRDPTPRPMLLFAIGATAVLTAALVAVVLTWQPQDSGVGTGASASDTPTPSHRPFGDPTYMNSDHSQWVVIDRLEGRLDSWLIRADWVDDAFCYELASLYPDGSLSMSSGDCFTQAELAADEVIGIGGQFGPGYIVIGVVPSEQVTRIEVTLVSGDVIEARLPSLFVPGRPDVRVFHAQAEIEMVSLRALDAEGRALFSQQLAPGP